MREDEIIIDNYAFWDFDQEVTHIVYFRYRNMMQNSNDDETNIRTLFCQIGLWEDYINIKRIVNEELQSGNDSSAIISNHSNDKFDIRFGEIGIPKFPICTVKYSRNEALRRTKGRDTKFDISIESFKKYLINLNKWLILKNNKKMLEN